MVLLTLATTKSTADAKTASSESDTWTFDNAMSPLFTSVSR